MVHGPANAFRKEAHQSQDDYTPDSLGSIIHPRPHQGLTLWAGPQWEHALYLKGISWLCFQPGHVTGGVGELRGHRW